MVSLEAGADPSSVRIWLQPNSALSWAQNRRLIGLHFTATLGLGAGFAAAGYWPIAAFLSLASGLLGLATWLALRRLAWRECITLTPEQILVQRGRRQPQLDRRCARCHARLQILHGATPWHDPTVLLDCAGRCWELGHDLNASDRRSLIRLLRASGLATGRR